MEFICKNSSSFFRRRRKAFKFWELMYLVVIFLSGCSSENAILDDNLVSEENSEEFATRSVKIVTVCIDAYVDVGGGGGGATYSVYKGTTCKTCMVDGGYEFQDGEYPAGGFPEYGTAQNLGSGGSTRRFIVGDNWRFQFAQLEKIYGFGSTLDAFQKGRLDHVLECFYNSIPREPYIFLTMYQKLLDKEVRIPFHVNQNQIHPGQFDTMDKSISFRSNGDINFETLVEEILHAVQYYCYYGSVMRDEDSNYEFEMKVFKDLSYHISTDYDNRFALDPVFAAIGQSAEFEKEYTEWLTTWSAKGYLPASEYATFKRFGAMWKSDKGTFKPNIEPKMLEMFRKPRPTQTYPNPY